MLKGRRVSLAPLRTTDLPRLFEWINDREQVLFNAPYKPVHEADHQAWFDSINRRSDVVIFGIRLVESEDLIGSCQLTDVDRLHRSASLQVRIGEVGERGHGYGTEAVALLLRHAFADLGLRRVQLQAFSSNAAALRCYAKVGFTQEGVLRQAAYIDGEPVDVVVMGILREEFADGDRD
jgi:RimJ/RimL family protein N-acetyltransferase